MNVKFKRLKILAFHILWKVNVSREEGRSREEMATRK